MRLRVERHALGALGRRPGVAVDRSDPDDVVAAKPAVAGDPLELRIQRPPEPGRAGVDFPRRGANVRRPSEAALTGHVEQLAAVDAPDGAVEARLAIPPDVDREAGPPRVAGPLVDEDRHRASELLDPRVGDRSLRLDEVEPGRDGLGAPSSACKQDRGDDATGQGNRDRHGRRDQESALARAPAGLLDQRLEVFLVLRRFRRRFDDHQMKLIVLAPSTASSSPGGGMSPSGDCPIFRPHFGERGWVLRRTLYSSLVVIGGVTLAFVAVAVTLAFNG